MERRDRKDKGDASATAGAGGERGALNQADKSLEGTRRISGSGNREGGYDMHPHPGDHGEAQRRGSPSEADYYGPDRGFPGTSHAAEEPEADEKP